MDSLKRLERLTENTPMAPVDKTPVRAEGCGVAMTMIGRDVFDEVITERDALRQQLATVAQERDGAVIHYNKILTEAAERVGDAEAKVAALTEALDDMQRASALIDDAGWPAEYQARLIALALIARKFLRKAALAAVREEK